MIFEVTTPGYAPEEAVSVVHHLSLKRWWDNCMCRTRHVLAVPEHCVL